jgi:DNA-binding beta-propeller fold protein YncE
MRPDVDLNSYYVLAMNKSADISVIDPLLGFGGSKLLTLVMLKSPGEDWLLSRATGAGQHDVVISSDNRFAFISNRESGTVSIVDIRKLEKLEDVRVGPGPVSMAL